MEWVIDTLTGHFFPGGMMRRVLVVMLFVTGLISLAVAEPSTAPSTMPSTAPTAINWDEAAKHVGEQVTVTGPVVGTHDFGDAAVLNVGKDFPDPDRFTVYISSEKRSGMPDDLDKGKIISVTGKLKLYRKVPEIEAGNADITVVGKAPATTQP